MKSLSVFLVFVIALLGNGSDAFLSTPRLPSRYRERSFKQTFILNGRPVAIEELPHKLSLRMFGNFICGASVISSKWALSAAHCLEFNVEPEYITLHGGTVYRLTGGYAFDVEEYTTHPQYDPIIYDYDVAVLKIKTTFDGFPNIRPVKLANEQCVTMTGTEVRLAGWGYNEKDLLSDKLMQIEQCIIDSEQCYKEWGGDITSRMLCASVVAGTDSCNGDSGGAVLKQCLQVGIISFGSPTCGVVTPPAVFTRIEEPTIRQFIRQHSGV